MHPVFVSNIPVDNLWYSPKVSNVLPLPIHHVILQRVQ
jgi:hypothetical protein